MSLECGSKVEHLEGIHADTGRAPKLCWVWLHDFRAVSPQYGLLLHGKLLFPSSLASSVLVSNILFPDISCSVTELFPDLSVRCRQSAVSVPLFLSAMILAHTGQVTPFSPTFWRLLALSVWWKLSQQPLCSNKPSGDLSACHPPYGVGQKKLLFKSRLTENHWISKFVVGILATQNEGVNQWVPRGDIEKPCCVVSLLPSACHGSLAVHTLSS